MSGAHAEHPVPSERARELVRGAYDTHVHISPDVVKRRVTDLRLAERFAELGLAGFGLKSHYTSTAERARVVSEAVPAVDTIGTITLNRAVGGLNPVAVEIAAREGARIVWFPTVSSENEQHEVLAADPDGKVPVWVRFELELREAGIGPAPVAVVADGELVPEARDVLAAIARHDLVLATGHLARDEIFTLVDGAVEAGVRRIVVTHPEFPSQRLPIEDQIALAGRGAVMERAFTTPYTGKCSWEQVFAATRAVGPERTVWSTDLGQVFNPPVEDGLAIMADQFLAAGFHDDEVRAMAVTNTRWIALGAGDRSAA
ncbi:MAG: hypothetical protein QOH72_5422 [Solirubrobacteraceae bacterium]|nr:hypothetical protein [Solirubrobacteraceae bacterium]